MKPQAIEIETERFVLRPIRPWSFAQATFHWTRDKESFASMTWKTEGWTHWRWFRQLRKVSRKRRLAHGIYPRGSSRPIGLHIVTLDARNEQGMLAVLIGERDWWGETVVAECRRAIIDDCFRRLKLVRLTGFVNARNFASIYNYQRLGFAREGVMRSYFAIEGGKRADQVVFGLLGDDWMRRRAQAPEGST